jgi:formyl-CoA transferase/CoA:oxalate CoA-transferase
MIRPNVVTPALFTTRRGEADYMTASLENIRVIDLTRVIAGPYCTQILGDLGADIIKIEQPGLGDEVRHIAPLYPAGESHYFLALNRNKRSVVVDLKAPEGRDFVLALAATADVVVENFRPGVMDRLGLGFEALRQAKPDIILCSISGYGQDGPLRGAPSFDLVAQARSGVMSINGEPSTPPTKLGLPIGDLGGGLWATIAIFAALRRRELTQDAQLVDVSLLDGLIALQGYLSQMALLTGTSPQQAGSDHHNVAPYGRYRAKDGYLVLAILVGPFWRRFCDAIERPDLFDDLRFATNTARSDNRDELRAILDEILSQRTRGEWAEIFIAGDVPSGPVLNIAEALHEPQVVSRGLLRTMDHPTEGELTVVGPPLRINGKSTTPVIRPAPLLGEHTRSVARDILGMDEERVEDMIVRGVIQAPSERPSP